MRERRTKRTFPLPPVVFCFCTLVCAFSSADSTRAPTHLTTSHLCTHTTHTHPTCSRTLIHAHTQTQTPT